MHYSDSSSCSDCKIEMIHKRWSKLLLNWINKCVNGKVQKPRLRRLSSQCLIDIITKYKSDICEDSFEKDLLSTENVDGFIKYKYPLMLLRHLSEDDDYPKKLYVMVSLLLYHCCTKCLRSVVHDDIYRLTEIEQELVLNFCERMSQMEATVHNTELAIYDAFDILAKGIGKRHSNISNTSKSSDTIARMSSSPTIRSCSSLPSDNVDSGMVPKKIPSVKFTTVTVLSSFVNNTDSSGDEDRTEKYRQTPNAPPEPKWVPCTSNNEDRERNKLSTESERASDNNNDILLNPYKVCTRISDERDENQKPTDGDRNNKCLYSCLNQNLKYNNNVVRQRNAQNKDHINDADNSKYPHCASDCSCTKCSEDIASCGDPGSNMKACICVPDEKPTPDPVELHRIRINRKLTALSIAIILCFALIMILGSFIPLFKGTNGHNKKHSKVKRLAWLGTDGKIDHNQEIWKCKNDQCQKVYQKYNITDQLFPSHSLCILSCTGPLLWPIPIGYTEFSKDVIYLATNKLEYKLKTVPSDNLSRYLAEAFKLFLNDLAKLEKEGAKTDDLEAMKMNMYLEVESEPDPRLKLNTDEAYHLRLETVQNQAIIKITSSSFCGVRHGLETLTQMILLDKSTGYLITLSRFDIKDAPSYRYRGLMIDTGRNYIPVDDLMRTVDAMATVKLNTFHWRVSDVTSFPLYLESMPQLFENGGYDRAMVYTKEDVKAIVKRAGVRGIRVVIEVAAPGPVGRAWAWNSGASCSIQNETCDSMLCMCLDSQKAVLNALHVLYQEIIEMTEVDDIFHLSNGIFSLSPCYNLLSNRDGFLDKALERLRQANKGFLPKLPIVWFTTQLTKEFEIKSWERYGVQLNEWNSESVEKFKVIHSSKWDLSCEMKKHRCKRYRSWQEMYSWKSWSNVQAFTVEGGEAILWTDLVNGENLDYHLWPRVAAVAERLWSDIVANSNVDGSVYVRLNNHRFRMHRANVIVQPIWPTWCTYNPEPCMDKIN